MVEVAHGARSDRVAECVVLAERHRIEWCEHGLVVRMSIRPFAISCL